jgi:hypothetical protein
MQHAFGCQTERVLGRRSLVSSFESHVAPLSSTDAFGSLGKAGGNEDQT